MKSKLINPATVVFIATILLVAAWIASGMIGRDDTPAPAAERSPPVVAASWSEARPVGQELSLYGEVVPTQVASVRSRTDGLVESVSPQGTRVEEGDVLAQLSTDDREARLARAEAQVASARRAAEAAQQLADRGVGPQSDVQARQAELEAARAELRAIQLEIENTTLRAPIAGVINRVIADIGAYVSPGGEVLEIVDNDPLIAVVQVQQSQIVNVRAGMPARIRFIGGEETQGEVRFVSPLADAATRTFRVEIEVPNPEGEVPAGISVEAMLVTRTVEAHHISTALVRLDEQGRLGLNAVDEDDRIVFKPVDIVMADSSGIWVAGLASRERLVTISQGAIAAGERVEVRETPPEYLSRTIAPGAPATETEAEAGTGADLPEAQE